MVLKNSYITWRERFLPLAVEKIKKGYMELLHPNRIPWNETTNSLKRYNNGTLGFELHKFLIKGKISLEPKYESHDVFHVLTGYGLGLNNEARMFFFLFGNGKRTISIIGSMVVALVFIPDLCPQFYQDYKRGKTYDPIKDLDFEQLLNCNLKTLKNELIKS